MKESDDTYYRLFESGDTSRDSKQKKLHQIRKKIRDLQYEEAKLAEDLKWQLPSKN